MSRSRALFSFLDQFKHTINECQWMNGIAGYVQIDYIFFKKTTIQCRTISKNPSTDSVCSGKNDNFWIGNGIITYLQWLGHIFIDRAGNHNAISMAWRCYKLNSKATHIKIYIAAGIQ